MAWLAAAAPYISAGVGVAQTVAQGNTQERIAEIEARQQREQGLADMAEAQQTATQERKRASFLKSRATALAAASGTSVDSPNVADTIADIDAQGQYNSLAALYSGSTSASSRNYAASLAKARGKSAKAGSYYQAGATVLDSANSNGWFG